MSRAVFALVVLAAAAHVARADDKADCDYLEFTGAKAKAPSIPPELKPLEKKLTKGPLSVWNEFKLLSAGHVTLTKNKPEAVKLNPGTGSLLLRDRNDKRLSLTIQLLGADGKVAIESKQQVNANEWNVWVQEKADTGHIFAASCK